MFQLPCVIGTAELVVLSTLLVWGQCFDHCPDTSSLTTPPKYNSTNILEYERDGYQIISLHYNPFAGVYDNVTYNYIRLDSRFNFYHYGLEQSGLVPEEDNSDIVRLCLGLHHVHLVRMPETDIRKEPITDPDWNFQITNHKGLEFFRNFPVFEINATFRAQDAVGMLRINKTCWEEIRSYKDCIHEILIKERMNKAMRHNNPFSQTFWDDVFEFFLDEMKGVFSKFHIHFEHASENVIGEWFFWMTRHIEMYDFRMRSHDWGHLSKDWLWVKPNLTRLDLEGNGINSIDTEILTAAPNISLLNLRGNKFLKLPKEIFNYSEIEDLDISMDSLKDVEEFFTNRKFDSFPKLHTFKMAHAKIKNPKLLEPLLKRNKARFYNLRTIDLNFCGLDSLDEHPDIFEEQEGLKELYLRGNIIVQSPNLKLHPSAKLDILDMSYNNFTYPGDMISEGQVKYLDMSTNNVTDWSNKDIWRLGHSKLIFNRTKTVNLSINTIPVVTNEMGRSLQELEAVDLGDNPIDCSNCSMPQFKEWLQTVNNVSQPRLKILFLNEPVDDFNCTRPTSARESNQKVSTIEFDNTPCLEKPQNLILLIGVPMASIASLMLLMWVILYAYRYEATYLMHLLKIRKGMKDASGKSDGDYKYDAFVCYKLVLSAETMTLIVITTVVSRVEISVGSDRTFVVGELLPTLENGPEKYKLCLHERDFPLGSFITHNIIEAMQNSRFTIVVLTDSFVQSQWCKWELDIVWCCSGASGSWTVCGVSVVQVGAVHCVVLQGCKWELDIWCKWELDMANHKLFEESREFLILVELQRLNRVELPRHLKYLMDTRTYLEWPSPGDDKGACDVVWERLKEALGESLYEVSQKVVSQDQEPQDGLQQDNCIELEEHPRV
uniref:TIR domain-containing protein n=1 Tax=Timema monikensis TaxID=170555 RepID=A0A7R9HQ39_9NEOP|nr:unnamed protein product [Timema monikensis]